MVIASFQITDEPSEVVTTYISSTSKHHYVCLHWISETPVSDSGFVGDGRFTFVELIVHIGRFCKTFKLIGR